MEQNAAEMLGIIRVYNHHANYQNGFFREIRKTLYNDEWWFVVKIFVSALTDSVQPKGYIKDMPKA